MKTKLFSLFLALAASVGTIMASDTQLGGIWYDLDSSTKTATVTYKGSSYSTYKNEYSGTVNIPSSVEYDGVTYNVTSIGDRAFYGCTGLTSVSIPNSVTSIGNYAFSGCIGLNAIHITDIAAWCKIKFSSDANPLYYAHNLYLNGELVTDLVIPNTITSIFEGAFEGCTSLTSVEISNSVTSIGSSAFRSCTGLTSIEIPNSVTSIGNSAFFSCTSLPVENNIRYADTYLVEAVDKTLSTYTIKEGTRWIGNYAFDDCTSLTSIDIPNSVTSIGDYAFYRCIGLNAIHITDIAAWCKIKFSSDANPLYYAHNLYLNGELVTDLIIPSSITSIWGAFEGCTSLTSVTIPNSVTTIGAYAFSGCTGLTSATIGNHVKSIEGGAFEGCTSLTSVTINTDSILSKKYSNKSSLKKIFGEQVKEYVLDNDVTSIGEYAFYECSGTTSVTIPNSVTSIGERAFYGCEGLTAVHITDIGSWCGITFESYSANPLPFAHNLYLNDELVTDLEIPNSVTSIGNYAFDDCTSLTSIEIPNSVTSIGNYAFSGCTGLTSIEIPNSVTSIGERAFSGCGGLISVTIGNSVTSIGTYAFSNCSGLTYIEIPNSVTSIGDYAFSGCSGLTSIEIPNSVTSIGNSAFYNCTGLTSIEIPNSVTSIGHYAFYGCSALTSVFWNAKHCDSKSSPFYKHITSFVFGDEVEYIPAYLCSGFSELETITIPKSVISIGEYAFNGCSGLTAVTINSDSIVNKNYSNKSSLKDIFGEQVKKYVLGNDVTSIGNYAFSGCTGLFSIEISSSVISIGKYSFENCTGMTAVTIPNSVTSIGERAFYGCEGLTSIEIPNSVTSIGSFAFDGCTGLTSVIWNAKNCEDFESYGPFHNIVNQILTLSFGEMVEHIPALLCSGMSKLESITIPNTVTSIGKEAFNGCSSLTSVTIPESVESINKGATFQNCTSLKEVHWNAINCDINPMNDKGNYYPPFYNLSNITNFTFGDKVQKIPAMLCCGLSGLPSVTIPQSVTSIGGGAFYGCNDLVSIDIPNSVTSIGNRAFENCTGLTSATIGNSVTSIGNSAFYGCTGLNSIEIPNSVTSIENYAFSGCSGLTSVQIPNSVTSIGSSAFYGCTGLTSIEIPKSVTSIESRTFYSCSGLTSMTIPNSVTSIGSEAFSGCTGLTSVAIPNSVTSIGSEAFRACTGLASVAIPNSVTSIGSSAFSGCTGLTSATIGNSVTSIGNGAFFGCTGLTSVTIGNSVTSIGNGAFFGCSGLTSIEIPNSVTSIGNKAFYNCTDLRNVTFGSSLQSISDSAFAYCKNFDDITCYATTVPTIQENTFAEIGNKKYIYLYVPEGRQRAYLRDQYWGEFDVQVKGATKEQSVEDITITPAESSADVVWPAISGAATYELVIKDKSGNVICTLIFDANGLLTEIAFKAPGRDDAPQKAQSAGFSFTITGLDSGTSYDLTLVSKDANGDTLDEETLSFTTKGDAPQSIDQITNDQSAITNKVIRDGQLLIIRGDKVYTMTGVEVK